MAPFGTLHTTTTFLHARVTKILAAANLNGLDVQVEPNFQYGITNKTPAYLAKFPHGKIPAFETPTGFYLAEASAIAFYIADSGPLRDQLLGRTPEDRALVQMWVGFADSGLWVDGGAILGPMLGTVGYNAEDVAFHDTQFMRCLRRLEEHLAGEGKVWLVRDEEVSLADLSVASGLLWPLKTFMDEGFRGQLPRVMAWWERLMAVKSVGSAFGVPVRLAERRPAADGSEAEALRAGA